MKEKSFWDYLLILEIIKMATVLLIVFLMLVVAIFLNSATENFFKTLHWSSVSPKSEIIKPLPKQEEQKKKQEIHRLIASTQVDFALHKMSFKMQEKSFVKKPLDVNDLVKPISKMGIDADSVYFGNKTVSF